MKKQLTALALSALLFAAAASGCNQTETNTSAQQEPDPAALASALLEGGSFDDQLSETDQQAAMTVLGLDPEQLGQVLMTASGSSYASKTLIPEILQGNFEHGFTMDRAYKDMEGMEQVCTRYRIPLPTLNGAMQTYQLALRRGEGERYKGAMIRFFEEMLGVECRAAQRTEGAAGAPERK